MVKKEELPTGKWFTTAIEILSNYNKERNRYIVADCDSFRRYIAEKSMQIFDMLKVLENTKSVPRKYHAEIAKRISDVVKLGVWKEEHKKRVLTVAEMYKVHIP